MKAIILKEVGKYAVVEKPVTKIKKGNELLVKIDACSICGSDMHILSDPPGYPATPGTTIGHEMVGTVVETGNEATIIYHAGSAITAAAVMQTCVNM